MAWQGGIEGGLATAELLVGEGNPSGKLVDTFARTLEDYPSTDNFHASERLWITQRIFMWDIAILKPFLMRTKK